MGTVQKLEQNRAGILVNVYIYESHPEGSFNGKATWHANYVRLEPDEHKAKPYRPESTESDIIEGEVYWIVERLRRMEMDEYIPVLISSHSAKQSRMVNHSLCAVRFWSNIRCNAHLGR